MYKLVPHEVPGGKPRKVPYYWNGQPRGETDTEHDRRMLATYEHIQQVIAARGPAYRMAFALGDDGEGGYWQGFDSDNSMEGSEEWGGYVERSPSGAGYHVIGYGRGFRSRVTPGHEYYSAGRFFTFTGEQIKDGPIVDLYDKAGTGPIHPREPGATVEHPPEQLNERQALDLWEALKFIDPDPYDNWYRVSLALQSVEGGLDVFLKWSARSPKHNDTEARKKFASSDDAASHWKAIFVWAKGNGWDPNWQDNSPTPVPTRPKTLFPISFQPNVPLFVIQDLVQEGFVGWAGLAGIGKTSLMVPLCLHAAHLKKMEGLGEFPRRRRKVLYLTEDAEQVSNIIAATHHVDPFNITEPELCEWFHVMDAERLPVARLRNLILEWAAPLYVEQEAPVGSISVPPLVVIDTLAANLALEEENSNAEVSKAIADLRQNCGQISIWLIGHAAKGVGGGDVEAITMRGAGAFGGDVRQSVSIGREDKDSDARMMYALKTRFRPAAPYWRLRTEMCEMQARDRDGYDVTLKVDVVSRMEPLTALERVQSKEDAKSRQKEESERWAEFAIENFVNQLVQSCPGRGVALLKPREEGVRGGHRPPEPPSGYLKLTAEGVETGDKNTRTARVRSWLAKGVYRESEDGRYVLFDKPDFGV
jgi:hypothetical protein